MALRGFAAALVGVRSAPCLPVSQRPGSCSTSLGQHASLVVSNARTCARACQTVCSGRTTQCWTVQVGNLRAEAHCWQLRQPFQHFLVTGWGTVVWHCSRCQLHMQAQSWAASVREQRQARARTYILCTCSLAASAGPTGLRPSQAARAAEQVNFA